jgi:hypothetical protein
VINQHHTETVNISFISLDEIDQASDSTIEPTARILDKATPTLGDNRRVDFLRATPEFINRKLRFAKIDEGLALQTMTSLIENGVHTKATVAKAA